MGLEAEAGGGGVHGGVGAREATLYGVDLLIGQVVLLVGYFLCERCEGLGVSGLLLEKFFLCGGLIEAVGILIVEAHDFVDCGVGTAAEHHGYTGGNGEDKRFDVSVHSRVCV